MKNIFILILIFVFGIIIYFSTKDAAGYLKTVNFSLPKITDEYVVKRVVDGDTIELSNGQKVRYIGINTPETDDPRKPIECFGLEAKEKNKALVEGKVARLEKDTSDKDVYGRLLRYIYIDNIMINDLLVKEGFANAATYPPDVKFANQFLESEKYARENKLGLWNKCNVK